MLMLKQSKIVQTAVVMLLIHTFFSPPPLQTLHSLGLDSGQLLPGQDQGKDRHGGAAGAACRSSPHPS